MDIQIEHGATIRPVVEVNLAPTSPLLLIGAVEEGSLGVFQGLPWPIRRVTGVPGFCPRQTSFDARVVICDDELSNGTWRDVIYLVSALRPPPPVIVTSRLPDDRLWAEVLNLGGFDLLAKPLDRREVDRVLKLAWDRTCRTVRRPIRRSEDGSTRHPISPEETEGRSIRL